MEDDDIIMTVRLAHYNSWLADRLETPKFVSPFVCGGPGQIEIASVKIRAWNEGPSECL